MINTDMTNDKDSKLTKIEEKSSGKYNKTSR